MSDDEATVRALAAELRACEAPLTLVLRPYSAFQIAGLLQLALRHRSVSEEVARTGRTFIDHVRAYYADQGADAVLDVLRRGDDPAEDR